MIDFYLVFALVLVWLYVAIAAIPVYFVAVHQGVKHSWLVFVPYIGAWFIGVVACNVKRWKISLTPLLSVITAILMLPSVYYAPSSILLTACFVLCCGYQMNLLSLVYDVYFPVRWLSIILVYLNPLGAIIVLLKLKKLWRGM